MPARLVPADGGVLHLGGRPPAAPFPGVDPSSWLTVALRPAGELGGREAARLVRVLVRTAVSADAVVLDLRAVLRVPDVVRVAVEDASGLLAGRGGALLVLDPDGQHHLGGNAVEIGGSLLAPPD